MPEEIARVGDVELAYETFGDPAHPAMLLVMGLATQMLGWRAGFCEALAERGFRVIRFDNRDVGRSTRFSSHRPPTRSQLLRRDASAAAYSLADMADDGVGLLDALGIDRAHVVGASMGGMIAQTIAFRHPDRVLSLVSIMSNTGARWSGQPALSTYSVLLKRAPRDREGFIAHQMEVFARIGSPGFARDEDDQRGMAGATTTAATTRRAPAASWPRSSPRATARTTWPASPCRRSSSTARRTSSSRRRAGARRRRRSPARGS
jgi:pimeloyl-ACP methyl ester carboxylesterase